MSLMLLVLLVMLKILVNMKIYKKLSIIRVHDDLGLSLKLFSSLHVMTNSLTFRSNLFKGSKYCQAQPKPRPQLGCAGSIPSFSVRPGRLTRRPSGIVPFIKFQPSQSKVKLSILMSRVKKHVQAIGPFIMRPRNRQKGF